MSELVALSCKEPPLVLLRIEVVLRPKISFLPKVLLFFVFHLNQDIALLFLCLALGHKGKYPHIRCGLGYERLSVSFQQLLPQEHSFLLHSVWTLQAYHSFSVHHL